MLNELLTWRAPHPISGAEREDSIRDRPESLPIVVDDLSTEEAPVIVYTAQTYPGARGVDPLKEQAFNCSCANIYDRKHY
jgi:hypothetical protein